MVEGHPATNLAHSHLRTPGNHLADHRGGGEAVCAEQPQHGFDRRRFTRHQQTAARLRTGEQRFRVFAESTEVYALAVTGPVARRRTGLEVSSKQCLHAREHQHICLAHDRADTEPRHTSSR